MSRRLALSQSVWCDIGAPRTKRGRETLNLLFSPRGEAKCVRGPPVFRTKRECTYGMVVLRQRDLHSAVTIGTANYRNQLSKFAATKASSFR